jgi:Flp pilus assembly protein TadG
MRIPTCKQLQAQRGVAMVEFAIALPLLLLLLLAIGEFGRMLYQYNSLQQASRDAGRYVAGLAWNATLGQIELNGDLQSKTKSVAVYGVPANSDGYTPVVPELTTDNVVVDSQDAEHVRVSITYTFRPVIGNSLPTFFGNSIPLNIALQSTVIMRVL